MSLLHTIGDNFWPAVFTIGMVTAVGVLFKIIAKDING